MLPDILFIGPTRSGTTWIDAYLRSRGDVSLPLEMKETFFFDKRYDRGIEWYRGLFAEDPDARRCLEVAPSLFHKPQATERLAADLTGVTVIVTLRDPVDRAVSHYFHYRRAGEPALPFMEMVRRKPDILEAGMYHKHLERWRRRLGEERVQTIFYDDLRRDAAQFCAQLCTSIELPYMPPSHLDGDYLTANAATLPPFPVAARVMSATVRTLRQLGADALVNAFRTPALTRAVFGRSVDPEVRSEIAAQAGVLRDVYLQDVEKLETMLGCDLGAWKGGGSSCSAR